MSRRLQVLVDEAELAEIRRMAKRQHMSTAEWVRHALRSARRQQPGGDAKRRLEVVRAAAKHDFPTGDIAQMLGEIEQGYLSGSGP
jgi:hypothetical protein